MIVTTLLFALLASASASKARPFFGSGRVLSLDDSTNDSVVSYPQDPSYNLPGEYGPSDVTWAKKAYGVLPEQVKLTYWGPGSVLVSWATGDATVGPQVSSLNPFSVQAVVKMGTSSGNYSLTAQGTSNNVVYTQVYTNFSLSPPDLSYSSPILHHVLINGLADGTKFFYVVGDPSNSWSKEYSFTTAPSAFPIKVAVIADIGTTYNASNNIARITANKPDILLITGDLSYADHFGPAGDKKVKGAPYMRSYQPRWDEFGRMLEQAASAVPIVSAIGNHELEPMSVPVMGAAYSARYPVPQDPSVVNTRPNTGCLDFPDMATCAKLRAKDTEANNVYYSVELKAGLAVFTLNPYYPYETSSKQYKWFASAIKAVDRTAYPWLVVQFHTPFYLTYSGNFKSNECMRQIYEPLFMQYGVDFVFSGHSHAYERTHPMYNFELNPCGPVYFLIGNGGTDIITALVDVGPPAAFCATNVTNMAPLIANQDNQLYYPNNQVCASFQNGTFCPSKQPAYSAFRESNFGTGLLTLVNATTATWAEYRDIDPVGTPSDTVTYTRTSSCVNRQAQVQA